MQNSVFPEFSFAQKQLAVLNQPDFRLGLSSSIINTFKKLNPLDWFKNLIPAVTPSSSPIPTPSPAPSPAIVSPPKDTNSSPTQAQIQSFPNAKVTTSFSDSQISAIRALFKKFLNEESFPSDEPNQPSYLLASFNTLKDDFYRSVSVQRLAPPTSGGGSSTSAVGSTTTEVTGSKVTGGYVQISGNSLTTTSGNLTIGSAGGTTTISDSLTLTGAFTGNSTASNSFLGSLELTKGLRFGNLTQAGAGGNYFAGNVGIGAINPETKLEVAGTASISAITTKNLNNVRYADQFSGADAGAKIAACIADLPSTGGTCDARGFEGAQTISSALAVGTASKPVRLLLGAATFTVATGANITMYKASTIEGIGFKDTSSIIIKNGPGPAIIINATATGDGAQINQLQIQGGTGGDSTSDGIYSSYGSLFIIDKVFISSMAGNGINLIGTVHVLISHSKVTNNAKAGIKSTLGSTLTIDGVYVDQNGEFGIDNATPASRVLNSVMEDNTGGGAFISSTGVFEGNELEANDVVAVRISGTYSIVGNVILPGAGLTGLDFVGGSYNFISGNTFGTGGTIISFDSSSNYNFVGPNLGVGTTSNNGAGNSGYLTTNSPLEASGGSSGIPQLIIRNTNVAPTYTGITFRMDSASSTGTRNWGIYQNSLAYGDFNIIQSNALGGDPVAAGTSRFYINNGYVGIGAISPEEKLEVAGNIIASASGAVDLTLNNVAQTYGKFIFRSMAGSAAGRLDIIGGAAGATTLMSIASSGYIGIGTTGPTRKLDVSSGDGNYTAVFRGTTNSIRFSGYIDAARGSLIETTNVAGTGYTKMTINGSSLALQTDGTDKVTISNGGNVGIGTTNVDSQFELVSAATTTNVASISGTSLTTGSAFSIRVPPSSSFSGPILIARDTNNLVLASLSSGGRFSLRRDILSHGAVSNCTGVGAPSAGCIDLAEEFPLGTQTNADLTQTNSDSKPTAGDLVSLDVNDSGTATIKKAQGPYDKNILGVITTNPGIVLSDNVYTGASAENYKPKDNHAIVALVGRVPLKVSNENGTIKKGDYLTSSSTAGIAMKATKSGRVIGIALEDQKADKATVIVLINPHWAGQELDTNGQLADFSGLPAILGDNGGIITLVINYLKDAILTVRQLVAREKVCIGETCITEQQLKELLEKNQGSAPTPTPEPPESPMPTPIESPTISPTPELTPEPSPSTTTLESTPTPEPTPEILDNPTPSPSAEL